VPRRLRRSWLDEYLSYIESATESPRKFHWWSAVTVLSSALKRHVWVDRKTFKLYPNLYTVLVARPGLGKGAAINPAIGILKESGVTNMLSDRITMEYVLEKLSKGFPAYAGAVQGKIKIGTDACVLVVSTELSVFITASQFTITALTDLWDSKEGIYGYGTRGKGEFNIDSPCVSLLGGSAQEWLVKSVPSDAVGGGFTRRVNFVLATKKERKIPWPSMNHFKIRADLIEDLREISLIRGEFGIAPNARPVFEAIYDASEADEFDDEATAGYKISRWANVLKVATCISVARGDTNEISKKDLEEAIEKTEEVANDIPIIFRAVGESPLVSASDKVLRYVELRGYASREAIMKANWRHLSSEDLDRIIVTLREGGVLIEKTIANKLVYASTRNPNP
jgi:hypothetical protein